MAKIIPFEEIRQLYNSYKKLAEDYGIMNGHLTSKDIIKINNLIDILPDKEQNSVKIRYNLHPIFENANQ